VPSNPVNWFEIYVNDMERAKHFYESVFDLKLEKMPNPDMEYWTFPMQDDGVGASGALTQMEGVSPGPGGSLIYFSCEDCATEESRVEPAGGKVQQPKMSIGEYGFMSLVKDSEGNLIGLHSLQ
jgi:predicted enzyme related to lactoylglutathione lyase